MSDVELVVGTVEAVEVSCESVRSTVDFGIGSGAPGGTLRSDPFLATENLFPTCGMLEMAMCRAPGNFWKTEAVDAGEPDDWTELALDDGEQQVILGGVDEMDDEDLLDALGSAGAFAEMLSVRGLGSPFKTLWFWKVKGGAFDKTKVGRVAADNVRCGTDEHEATTQAPGLPGLETACIPE